MHAYVLVQACRWYLHGCWLCARGIGHPQRSVYLIRFSTGATRRRRRRRRRASSLALILVIPFDNWRPSRSNGTDFSIYWSASSCRCCFWNSITFVRAATPKAISLPLENWHTAPRYIGRQMKLTFVENSNDEGVFLEQFFCPWRPA